MAYKITVKKEQAKLRRPTPDKFGDFKVTVNEHFEGLKLRRKQIEDRLRETRIIAETSGWAQFKKERKDLKKEKDDIDHKIRMFSDRGAGRGKTKRYDKKYGRKFGDILIDVIKANVSPEIFRQYIRLAVEAQIQLKEEFAKDKLIKSGMELDDSNE